MLIAGFSKFKPISGVFRVTQSFDMTILVGSKVVIQRKEFVAGAGHSGYYQVVIVSASLRRMLACACCTCCAYVSSGADGLPL